MATDHRVGKKHESFSNALFQALAGMMTKASGSPWQIETVPDASPVSDGSEAALVNCILEGSLQGEFLLEVRRGEAQVLASSFLGQTVAEQGKALDTALLGLFKASIKDFCSALELEYGVLRIETSTATERQHDMVTVFQATVAGDTNPISVLMFLDQALIDSIDRHVSLMGSQVNAEASKATTDGSALPEQVNLNLVMDVELNVTLRFGQRKLTLREVLELTTGSVVELDRQVEEPVELLLDGVVIARGEAVVVDGNYGLRVTEVLQPVASSVLQ